MYVIIEQNNQFQTNTLFRNNDKHFIETNSQ